MGNETEYDDQDQFSETVILTRWDRIKQWIEIVVATKKVAMLIWSLVFATGGAVIVGEVTDTKPIRDAAVTIGLVDELPPADIVTTNAMYEELMNLIDDVEQLEERMGTHQHDYPAPAFVEHEHDTKAVVYDGSQSKHTHAEYALVDHNHPPPDLTHSHPLVEHTHQVGVQQAQQQVIDDALAKHILNDH